MENRRPRSERRRSSASSSPALLYSLKFRLVIGLGLMASMLFAGSAASAEIVLQPTADLRVTVEVDEAPRGGGINTGTRMAYTVNIRNRSGDTIPERTLAVVAFVKKEGSQDPATMEVARFVPRGLIPASGGICGNGRHQILRCTNGSELEADQEISFTITHRHPAAESGRLSFFVEVTSIPNGYIESNPGDNDYDGPIYFFRNPPTTTTTMPDTTTTTAPDSTTTTVESSSTTDPSSSTTDPETTTTIADTTTTTEPSTTTTLPTTTAPTTTTTIATTAAEPSTSIEAMADTDATVLQSGDSGVAGVTGSEPEPPESGDGATEEGLQLALGPEAEESAGRPYLLILGLLAGLLLLGGIGLATYLYYDRPPPLVDLRRYE